MKELDKVKNINNNQIEKTVQIGSIYDDYQIFYDIAFKENEPINNESLDYKEENYYSECKKNIADYDDKDSRFYALGGEAMWEIVEWQYIMIYCNLHTEKEKNDLIELVNNAVEKTIINMISESEYSQHEQQCMIEGAKSIMLDKMVGASIYGMLSRIFPKLF